MSEQRIFMCPVHKFVTVVSGNEMSCRDTPGDRDPSCEECEKAVADAFAAAKAGVFA